MRIFGFDIGNKRTPPTVEKKGFQLIGYGTGSGDPTANSVVEQPWENGAVLAGIRWLTRTFSEAPIVVEKLNDDGVWETQPNHPAATILDNPNPFYTGRLLWSGVLLSMLVGGAAYILIARDGNGRVRELYYASHQDVMPVSLTTTGNFIDHYEYTPCGKGKQYYKPDDVIYIRELLDPNNPIYAIDPSRTIRRELKTDVAASQYSQRVIERNGTTLAISLKDSNLQFDDDDAEQMRRVVANATSGEGRGEPIVFSEPIEVTKIGSNPEELAIQEITSAAEQRITAVLGVHPMLLGLSAGNDSRTYNNMSEARQGAYESFLLPLQALICDALKRSLLPAFAAPGEVLRYRFDISGIRVLQEDEDALHTRYREDYKCGLIDRAEFRAKCGLPVRSEDEGVYYSEAAPGAVPAESKQLTRLQRRLKAMRELHPDGEA